jgi:hypothetical protein
MTAPDHMSETFKNCLHETGHPHMGPPANPGRFTVSVFEAFGKRAFHMAADPRRINHAERRAIVVAHRRFGLAPPVHPCCEKTITSGLNTNKYMALLEVHG